MIIILLIIVCSMSYILFFNNHQAKIGSISFNLPQGYNLDADNKLGDKTITNGSSKIYIAEYDNGNISTQINGYIVESNRNGFNVSMSNFTINNITVYKSTLTNNSANHYWFSYNNKIYSIYTWAETPNIDAIVFEMIKSIKPITNK